MIHAIGDSHSAVFSGKEEMQPIWPQRSDDTTPYFKSYRIGPATAYQLHNKTPIINDIIQYNVNKENDYVMFCLGEVDARAHLIKQAEHHQVPISISVEECVNRYFKVVQQYKNLGYKIIIWGVIASWHPDKEYTGGPSFGTMELRNNVTKLFNDKIKELCLANDIKFVSIFDKMTFQNDLGDYITKHEYLDNWDGCHMHLSQTSMPLIIDAFKEQELI